VVDRPRRGPGDVPHAGRGTIGSRAECTERDCDVWVPWKELVAERARAGVGERDRFTLCPKHPGGRMAKRAGP
jgi:tRNA-splicing ligase RtcB